MFQKIKLAVLSWFCSPDTVADYIAKLINSFLSKTNVAKNVNSTITYLGFIIPVARPLTNALPKAWQPYWTKVVEAMEYLYESLADGQLSSAEIQAAAEGIKLAIAEWKED